MFYLTSSLSLLIVRLILINETEELRMQHGNVRNLTTKRPYCFHVVHCDVIRYDSRNPRGKHAHVEQTSIKTLHKPFRRK